MGTNGKSAEVHENARALADVRIAFFHGDVSPALELYDPDLVWTNDEAAGPVAGTFRGLDAVLSMLAHGVEAFDGTLSQEVHATFANDDWAIEVMTERAVVAGRRFENRAVYLYRFRRGRIVEVATLDRDREAAREFWATVERGRDVGSS